MDREELRRRLAIGFLDFLSLEERHNLIKGKTDVPELHRLYPETNFHDREVEDSARWLEADNRHRIIWYGEQGYPSFDGIESRLPYMLFFTGEFPVKRKTIAVVGTRNTDNCGLQMAYKLGLEVSFNGMSVVSGLADGCDQASLNGAVDGGSPCYAVIGCGLEIDYPKFTNRLKRRIIEGGGALISRFAPDTPPLKYNFPNRNVIISALSFSTVVVQAPKRSGSLITSDFTLQMGKDVYVSQAGIGKNWNRLGSNNLANDGAPVIFSVDGITECNFMAFETDYASSSAFRFGNRLYIFKRIRKM